MPETARAGARQWLAVHPRNPKHVKCNCDWCVVLVTLQFVCDEADALAAIRDQLKADLEQRRMALIWGESPDDEF